MGKRLEEKNIITEFGGFAHPFAANEWDQKALQWYIDGATRRIKADVTKIRVCILTKRMMRSNDRYLVAWYSLPYEWINDDTWEDAIHDWPGQFYKHNGIYNGNRVLVRFTINNE